MYINAKINLFRKNITLEKKTKTNKLYENKKLVVTTINSNEINWSDIDSWISRVQ